MINNSSITLKDNSNYSFQKSKQDSSKYCVSFGPGKEYEWNTYRKTFKANHLQQAIHKIEDALKKRNQSLFILNEQEFEKSEDSFFLRFSGDPYRNFFNIQTQNLVGVIQVKTDAGNFQFSVRSRFEKEEEKGKEEKEEKDPFLMRMLQTVMGLYMPPFTANVSNDDKEYMEWFLIFLWISALKQAYRHGIWRQYRWQHYNDYVFRGKPDIARHLRQNIPFQGRIACRSREMTADHPLNRLILAVFHYIEKKAVFHYIEKKQGFKGQFDESLFRIRKTFFNLVSKPSKDEIWHRLIHLKPAYHPLYYEYELVRQFSIALLRMERMSMSLADEEQEVQGILLDVALLFEGYIRSLLKKFSDNHWNLENKGKLKLFRDDSEHIVPDYILQGQDKRVVLDAKYKRWDFRNQYQRSDIYQVMAYGLHQQADFLGIVHPADGDEWETEEKQKLEKELDCYGGKHLPFVRFPFPVSKYPEEPNWDVIENDFVKSVYDTISRRVPNP